MVNYKLKSILTLKNMSIKDLSKKVGISYNQLLRKINGISEFRPKEIKKIKETLNLSDNEIIEIFL